ncbi:cation transporter [Shigella flexneri]
MARLTTLAAFVNAIALVVIIILIVWEAIERFRTPRPVEGGMTMALLWLGRRQRLLFRSLHHGSEKNLTYEQRHCMCSGTCWVRLAIIAALIIIWTGWTPADPILSIPASLLVLRSAWRLLKQSANE